MIHAVWEGEEVNPNIPTSPLQPPEWASPGNPTSLPLQTGSSALRGNEWFSISPWHVIHNKPVTQGIPPAGSSYLSLSFPNKSALIFQTGLPSLGKT